MKHTMPKFMPSSLSHQYGFTLIELMISLVLGLLISAAVIQVTLTSQRVERVQTAGSEIQDKAVFGLQYIERQVRLANLGNDGVSINDVTALGGIVLTASADSDSAANVFTIPVLADIYLTSNLDDDDLSNIDDIPSDRLTIQYINTTGRILYDCEGSKILENEHVITRYFVADAGGTGTNARKNLNLRCDAGRINSDGTLEDFTDSGETIIENIDQFNIRLGVQHSADNGVTYQYADMTVEDYMDLDGEKPAITNIRIAILARSTANSPDASADVFNIFGSSQMLKAQPNAPKYLRRVYESNILLRNARVMRIIDSSSAP